MIKRMDQPDYPGTPAVEQVSATGCRRERTHTLGNVCILARALERRIIGLGLWLGNIGDYHKKGTDL